MSIESSPAAAATSRAEPEDRRASSSDRPPTRRIVLTLVDAGLVVLFLGLTFLLGVFPLKDADIFWHLRTGQIIRETGQVPRTDFFTFTREGAPWIDLHWIFQIGVSWLYERGGAVALNLAKCGITCLAMAILLSCRRRDWPLWPMLIAWLPALLVLGGRMYVRPETLSLLYISIFLAVLTRWDRHPYLVALLPIVQVAWVNSHGLFVLGPIVMVMAMLDAAIRPGSLAMGPRRWWRIAGIGAAATFAACLFNPYGISGAIYPIELAGTMTSPVFSLNIAELTPINVFIRRAGLGNLPLQIHFFVMALGAWSFLVPLLWSLSTRFARNGTPEKAVAPAKPAGKKKGKGKSRAKAEPVRKPLWGWRPNLFRVLLYGAFSYLSLQATRNSHQFAAVVGSITAWNFGEWAAAVRRRAAERGGTDADPPTARAALMPRLVTAGAIVAVVAWVGSGLFYRMTGEGRVIGLGEEPLFFPHEAVKFAGRPEMPTRFLSFHNAHASLFEFYHGPERKVYTDPRLEVAGASLFQEYVDLGRAIRNNERGWAARLDELGRPVVLIDHDHAGSEGPPMLASPHWRCVWFDPIAAVFVHDSAEEAVRRHAVDFAARHFRPDEAGRGRDRRERAALAKAFRNYVIGVPSHRSDLVWPLVWLGLDVCRSILAEDRDSAVGWKMMGQIEDARNPPAPPPASPRYRLAFDPVLDLSPIRATYAQRRAMELDPDDLTTLIKLDELFARRGMHEEGLAILERLEPRTAAHPGADEWHLPEKLAEEHVRYAQELGSPPSTEWNNMAELDRLVADLLARGRARTAADVLEKANPPERASWEVLDRMATLRLHLGEPARARALWQRGIGETKVPAVAAARVAATHLVELDFEAARRSYRRALAEKPDLFEACYGLALLEQDAGDAKAAAGMAGRAVACAPDARSRDAAAAIARAVERFR